MGKWAQSRKRGGGTAVANGPQPPPAPLLDASSEFLIQLATGAPDTGGSITLESSDDGGLTWTPIDTNAWQSVQNWGDVVFYGEVLLRGSETGNGTTYTGTTYSNVVDLRP